MVPRMDEVFRALADPQYAADLAALVDECTRRDVAIMAIKAGAWRPWGERAKTATPWYEPFTDAERLRRAVRSGIEVSALGMGCWAIGGPWIMNGSPAGWSRVDDAESLRALQQEAAIRIEYGGVRVLDLDRLRGWRPPSKG